MSPLLHLAAAAGLRAAGWRIEGAFPHPRRFVVIGAPHTSWWDFLLTLALMGWCRLPLRWLGKESLFRGPLGPLFQALGGLPVDRASATGVVEQLARRFRDQEEFVVGVAPEGTRRRVDRWRSGFYRLALAAEVPVVPVRVEADLRILRIGPPLRMTGDLPRDVATVASFFAGAVGIRPEGAGPVCWE